MSKIVVSTPGRICLFGEHQDFLGLPVIAAAIDRRITLEGSPRQDSMIVIDMPDIGRKIEIDLSKPIEYADSRDYLRSCINVLRREGLPLTQGFDCRMTSNIPINAGVSSSSAMIVCWIGFLVEFSGKTSDFSQERIARLAHRAEVLEFGEPGGMMDQFSTAMGKVIYVDCRPPFAAKYLPIELDGFVLGDSLQKKETLKVLSNSKNDVHEGLRLLEEWHPGFDLHTTPLADVETLLQKMPEASGTKVRANLIDRELTVQAMEMFEKTGIDPVKLGKLLTLHHEQLSSALHVSTEKIDRMIQASLDAGALGAKINGSGGGGCMFAYAPGRQDEVIAAIEREGGKGYKLVIDTGVRVEAGE